MTVTQVKVDAAVAFWKPRLGLEKWSIRAVIVGAGSLEGAFGDCDTDPDSLSAVIRVRDEQPSELEFLDTVIHELLHCVFWWTPDKGKARVLEEQAFRLICPALAALCHADLVAEWQKTP